MKKIDVLDKGYIRLTHQGGTDREVVNAARVSFDREVDELTDADKRLLRYLATHNHTSPFRHVNLGLEIYAPLMVARQWWKHVVGAPWVDTPWNESSRRYITENVELYLPDTLKAAPENRKQGAGGKHDQSAAWREILRQHQLQSVHLYNAMVEDGVAVEQARLALPAYGLYVRWRWVPTLQAAHHFYQLRNHGDAQGEIQQYAVALGQIAKECYPDAWGALRYAEETG